MLWFFYMKNAFWLFIVFAAFVGCAQQEKKSDSITDKQKWQNVDSELKKGAKKTKGLLQRAGILSDEKDSEGEESEDEKTKNKKVEDSGPSSSLDSSQKSFWSSMQNQLNAGWNRMVGFFDGLTERDSSNSRQE